jgi:hypothetical protein
MEIDGLMLIESCLILEACIDYIVSNYLFMPYDIINKHVTNDSYNPSGGVR